MDDRSDGSNSGVEVVPCVSKSQLPGKYICSKAILDGVDRWRRLGTVGTVGDGYGRLGTARDG